MALQDELANQDSVASSIAFLLSPLLSIYKQNIDKMVQPYGISAGQAPLVMLLATKDGRTQKELAYHLGVKPSSLTTMINRMEKTGLVERRRNETDNRAVNVFLTPKGRRASRKMQAIVRFINERNLAGFREEEKILLLRFMEQMMQNMLNQRDELMLIKEDEMLLREYRDSQKRKQEEQNQDAKRDEMLLVQRDEVLLREYGDKRRRRLENQREEE